MVNNYIYAYIIYALVVYIIGMMTFKYKLKMKNVYILILILIITNAFIASIRPSMTQDTSLYNLIYDESCSIISTIKMNGIGTFFGNRSFYSVELFYILVMSIFRLLFSSPFLFYFIQGIVSNICMIYGLFCLCEYIYELDTKEKKIVFASDKLIRLYACYLLFCGILYTSSAIRDGLSLSIGLVALSNLLLQRKKLLSVVLIFFSILIHTKSLIIIPLYLLILLWHFKISRKHTYIISVLIPILYFGKIGKFLVPCFTWIIKSILQLFNIQAFYSYITNLDFRLPMREGMIIVITCFLIALAYKEDKKISKYLAVVFCGLFIFVFAYPIPALARILYIFLLFIFPLIIKDSKFERHLYYLSFLYLVPQVVYVFGYL